MTVEELYEEIRQLLKDGFGSCLVKFEGYCEGEGGQQFDVGCVNTPDINEGSPEEIFMSPD